MNARGRRSPDDGDAGGDGGRRSLFEDGASWRRRHTREIRHELADHIERRTAALVAQGYTAEAARAEAVRRLGDIERIERDCMKVADRRRSRMRVARWLDDLGRDVRVAARAYAHRPLPAIGIVVTIALAIGAAAAVFSMMRGVLLAPLAFPEPDYLYSVYTRYLPATGYDFEWFALSGPEFDDYAGMTHAMTGVAVYGSSTMNLTPAAGEPERVRTLRVSSNIFDVLDVHPALGRAFAEDDVATGGCVVVLGDGLWREAFGSSPSVVGHDVRLNGRPCTVLGVMPAGFGFPDERTRIYVAERLDRASPLWDRESHPYAAVARLATGSTPAAAQAEVDALRSRWSAEYPDHYARGHFIVLRPFAEDVIGTARTPLLVLLGAVGVVLVIVIVNVAGLLLASAESRRREFAVRSALGVTRGRLVRQLLTESVLLAAAGGVLGLVASKWLLRGLIALYPGRLPRASELHIDPAVLLCGVAVACLSGMLFGLLPAARMSSVRLSEVLRMVGRGMTPHAEGVRARRIFVVAQTALALVLALGAALLARSYAQLRAVDLGFDPAHVLTFDVAVPPASQPDASRARDYFVRLENQLAAIPGVEAAGTVSDIPLRSGGGADDFIIEGRALPAPGQPGWNARYQMATSDALAALGLRLASGRWIAPTDVAGAPPVAVINEATARVYFAGEDPLGKRVRYYGPDSTWITIVGVVRDVRQLGVMRDAPPALYTSLVQALRPYYEGRLMSLVVRFRGDPAGGVAAVRRAAATIDRTLPPGQIRMMEDIVTESVGESRFTTMLMSAFAALALLLGALGVYGVLAHTVSLRRHEIGVRLALGAEPRSVLGMVVGQGVSLVMIGAALGLVATLALRRTVQGLLYGVQPFDPLSIALAAGALLATSLVACVLPAWRAARVDPLEALREE